MGEGHRDGKAPAELTRFVGRRAEMQSARRWLAASRLIVIVGPGGVGKSRLARELAAHPRSTYPDGRWVVDVSAVRDRDLLAREVLAALGVRDHSAKPGRAVLLDFLADRQLLLVLDGCERILDAVEDLATSILEHTPRCRVVLTSRHRPHTDGARVLEVGPLSLPDPASTTGLARRRGDAVALFTDRATSANHSITPADQAAVDRICRALEGIPLAIEMTAARLSALSPQELADRLDTYGALTELIDHTGNGNRMAAALELSAELCTPAERLLWARCSVFTADFDLDAVIGICAGDGLDHGTLVDVVEGLVDKSILRHAPDTRPARFHVLDVVREHGRRMLDRLDAPGRLHTRRRVYFHDLARRADQEWFTDRQTRWHTRLAADIPHIRAVLEDCLTRDHEPAVALDISAALGQYWIFCGSLAEGRHWVERSLAQNPTLSPERARAAGNAAWLALCQGDTAAARPLLAACTEATERFPLPRLIALADFLTGCAALFDGDLATAITRLRSAAQHDDGGGTTSGDANVALLFLAMAAAFDGKHALAREAAATCISSAEQVHAEWATSWGLWAAGLAAWADRQPRRAAQLASKALRRQHALGDHWGPVWSVELLAWATCDNRDYHEAARFLGAAHTLRHLTNTALIGLAPFEDAHQRCETQVREVLGEADYAAAFAPGLASTADRAITAVLTTPEDTTDPWSVLTGRERDIVRRLAHGLRNRDIGEDLAISPRTVETHIGHIFAKLGLRTRGEITAWAADPKPPRRARADDPADP